MNTNKQQISKSPNKQISMITAIIFFCLFLMINYLSAQEQGTYKYIIVDDQEVTNILEINNQCNCCNQCSEVNRNLKMTNFTKI